MILNYEITSPIAGKIEQIHGLEGEFVKKGDLLIQIITQKGENPIYSSINGYISNIEVQQGDEVIPGMVLIILKEQI